jgi:hypothetical protein
VPLDSLILREGSRVYHSDVPLQLVTGTGVDPRPRLRVDTAQTSFLEGRQFRVFHEFNIASGATLVGRFITTQDVVVLRRHITVVQGNLRYVLNSGGTPTGTFTSKTVFPVNSMASRPSPAYTSTTLATIGGTALTGGTDLDAVLLETGSSQAVSVQNIADEVGLPAGTYYVAITNTGGTALRGVYQVVWEEVMPQSPALITGIPFIT